MEPEAGFEHSGNRSPRYLKCSTCGRKGYEGGSWMDACRRGHVACPRGCGRLLATYPNGEPHYHVCAVQA